MPLVSDLVESGRKQVMSPKAGGERESLDLDHNFTASLENLNKKRVAEQIYEVNQIYKSHRRTLAEKDYDQVDPFKYDDKEELRQRVSLPANSTRNIFEDHSAIENEVSRDLSGIHGKKID